MNRLKTLLSGALALFVLSPFLYLMDAPAPTPLNVDLGFDHLISYRMPKDFSLISDNSTEAGFMKMAGYGREGPPFNIQAVVTLPDVEGSEGAMAFVLLSALSVLICLARRNKAY